MMQKISVIGVTLVVALTGSEAPHAQPAPSNLRIWTGTWEEHDSWEGSAEFGRSQSEISFVYVQGQDEFGLPRWDSRRLTWSAAWEDHRFDRVWVEQYGAADERGIYSNRSRVDIVTVCSGGGTLELGPAVWGGEDLLTPEQKAQLRPSCVTTYRQREAGPTPPPTSSQRDALGAPSVPDEDDLTGCSHEKTWRMGTNGAGSFSVSVSGPPSARAFHDLSFVPSPGATFRVGGRSPTPVRWKFVIERSSRLKGYATNAGVDAAFFEIHGLMPLRGSYGTMDPDLIFDPTKFEPPWDQSRQWKRPYPDTGAGKWSTLESREASLSVDVNLSAMDFGAHGQVQVFASSGCDDAWVPVPKGELMPRDTRTGPFLIDVPEDADGNFMADSLAPYERLAPRDDTDGEPVGDGTAGDGFTVFEEYRGFVAQTDRNCNSRLRVTHQRSNPVQKDLFIRAADPLLWRAAEGLGGVGMQFGGVSTQPLAVHMICPAQYSSDHSRTVNFTMNEDPEDPVRTALLTRGPQKGLRLVNEPLTGVLGRAIRISPANRTGPGSVDRVAVDIESIRRAASDQASAGAPVGFVSFLRLITFHELGHAVGLRHHGDGNIGGPVAFRKTVCPPGMTEATEASEPGVRICIARGIAVRGAENCGNSNCPMKYTWWRWYVPAGSSLTADTPVNYRPGGSWRWSRPRQMPAYVGEVLPYRKDRDYPGLTAFCPTKTGTGINALPGNQNHAGDLTGSSSCAQQLRVKDPSPGAGTQ